MVHGVPSVQGGSYWHCQGVNKEDERGACRKLEKWLLTYQKRYAMLLQAMKLAESKQMSKNSA